MAKKSLNLVLILVALLPILSILIHMDFHQLNFKFPLGALWGSVLQSSLSAGISVIFGFLGALGLLSVERSRTLLLALSLMPTLIPALFVIVIGFFLFNKFPFGLWGIVFLHSFINIGLVSVIMAQRLSTKFYHASLMAEIDGASWWSFLRALLSGIRTDLLSVFLTVFIFSMSSFSIPFIAGGGKFATLEVTIFEEFRQSGFSLAGPYSLIQLALIFLLSLFLPREGYSFTGTAKMRLLPHKIFLPFVLGPPLLCLFVMLTQTNFKWMPRLFEAATLNAALGSLFIGVAVGLGIFTMVLLMTPILNSWGHRFFMGFSYPGISIVAVGVVLLFPVAPDDELIRLPLALILVLFLSLYRALLSSHERKLERLNQQAEILGAGYLQKWIWVFIPQSASVAGLTAAIGAVWAMGDFALSRFLMSRPVHLAMKIDHLLERYRVEMGLVTLWLLFVLCVIVFLTFLKLGHVFSKKPILRI